MGLSDQCAKLVVFQKQCVVFFLSLSVHEVKRGLRVAASNAEPSSSQITGLRAHSVPSLFRVLASESSPFKKASGWRGQMQGRLVHRGGPCPLGLTRALSTGGALATTLK